MLVLLGDAAFIKGGESEPMLKALCEDGCQNRVCMESLALVGKLLEESGARMVAGGMGATEDVFIVFGGILEERAPVRIAGTVFANKLTGRKHFVTQLYEVGAALGSRSGKAMGVPVDGVRHLGMPAVAFHEALEQGAGVSCVSNGDFVIAMNGMAKQFEGDGAGRGEGNDRAV